MGLTAASYLGPNTVTILRDLTAYLAATTGIAIEPDARSHSSSDALAQLTEGSADLAWACGKLSVELLDAHQLAAHIVAAPVFAGESEAVYHSVIVTRHDGPATLEAALATRLGVNELQSWSGHLGLRDHLQRVGIVGWFDKVTVTGSHLNSVQALEAGRVEVAAIDHTIWQHIDDKKLATSGSDALRVLGRTVDWPAPPFLLRDAVAPELAARLTKALIDLPRFAIAGIDRIVTASAGDYVMMR
jgi:ABC-type phosphate/phosphonate transport system substrate-binding protein